MEHKALRKSFRTWNMTIQTQFGWRQESQAKSFWKFTMTQIHWLLASFLAIMEAGMHGPVQVSN